MKEAMQDTRQSGQSERFTVCIPRYLYDQGEEPRTRYKWNRSQFVAHLYELYLEQMERGARLARYTAAYALVPETEGERALMAASMEVMAAEDP